MKKTKLFLIICFFLMSCMFLLQRYTYDSSKINTTLGNPNFRNLNLNKVEHSNASVISDGYMGTYWNDGGSYTPKIAKDSSGNLHVVWADSTSGAWGTDWEIMYANYTEADGWSNVTIISDGYMGEYWNNELSSQPNIAIDGSGGIHVVWEDFTPGVWGNDKEIMYANYIEADGWSNATVISDGYAGIYWNDGASSAPEIAVDDSGGVHVVWLDWTEGAWGIGFPDAEIMYANYTEADGWSNATVISDGYAGIYWNDGISYELDIAVDINGNLHVVWDDGTIGPWGDDTEIMYAKYTEADGWSNATVISAGYAGTLWNDGDSYGPKIATDGSGNLHVAWYDDTDGAWGDDAEIMYASYTEADGWSNAIVISDGYAGIYWNDGDSYAPEIAVDDSGGVHLAWVDWTEGVWGNDTEIMYVRYTKKNGWSNITVISDGYAGTYWNDKPSYDPAIAVDDSEGIHVVWEDYTEGVWGNDTEIMYTYVSVLLTPDSFILRSTANTPDEDGTLDLTWTKSYQACNYSVYESTSGHINVINGSVSLIEDGLTTTSKRLSEYTTGTYYFIIEAINEYGSTLSNCIMVEIEIPTKWKTKKIVSIADATLQKYQPSRNTGELYTDMLLGEGCDCIIKFDLSEQPDEFFKVEFCFEVSSAEASINWEIYNTRYDWHENSVTWNNAPDYGLLIAQGTVNQTALYKIVVTDHIVLCSTKYWSIRITTDDDEQIRIITREYIGDKWSSPHLLFYSKVSNSKAISGYNISTFSIFLALSSIGITFIILKRKFANYC